MSVPHSYKFTIITPETSEKHNFAPQFWINHPDWKFYVRTNYRHPDYPHVWLGGGGATLEEAIQSAENSLRLVVFTGPTIRVHDDVILIGLSQKKLVGVESETPIQNEVM